MTESCHVEPGHAGPRPGAAGDALTVVLVGRPNSGKSSLFNALTGSDAHVGNYPGVTVEALEARLQLPSGESIRVIDLPGTYSLEADVDPESDEGIARAALAELRASGAPVLIAQVLDSTNLAASLHLTGELTGWGLPLLLLVTQRDVLEAEGRTVDVRALTAAVGAPAVWVSARSRTSRPEVLDAVTAQLRSPAPPAPPRPFNPRTLAHAALASAAPAEARLALHRRTESLDRVLMHPVAGPVAFLALMSVLFTGVFLIAEPASAAVGGALEWVGGGVRRVLGDGLVASFFRDGILRGAGTVVQFLPQIVLLTVALELIEASGYLARGAYLLDRLLRLFGLGGRSFVPLLMGHACAVPAIAATRAIRDPRQRLRTMLVLPLTTCSARIPAYALLIATFLPQLGALGRALTFLALYGLGLAGTAIASAVIGGTLMRQRRSLPLVLEMPPYRRPELRAVLSVAARGARRFLREVGTVIVAVSAVLWVLLSVPVGQGPPAGPAALASTAPRQPERTQLMARSLAARVGRALEPVTAPLGFDWRINVGLIGSFGARELMVSTMGIIFGIESADDDLGDLPQTIREARRPDGTRAYSPATGFALLVFFVFACQCMSTVSALRQETRGWRWPAFVLGYTYVAAYAAAWVVYQGARVFGWG